MSLRRFLPFLLLANVAAAPAPVKPPLEPKDTDEVDPTPGTEGQDPGAALLDKDGPKAPKPAGSLVDEANRIVTTAKKTSYSHKTSVDEAALRFDVDCSGFVGYILRRVAPQARQELIAATVKRPLAKHFVSFIQSLPAGGAGRWQPVTDVHELRAGDIIAWVRPNDSKSTNTGHTMIVAAAPTMQGRHNLVVPIFDSTGSRHGREDQRAAGSATGVGRGAIVLRVTGHSGKPMAFRWSRTGSYRFHDTEIVMAHVKAE